MIPVRLQAYINTNHDGNFDKFISKVKEYEKREPSKAKSILDNAIKSPVKISKLSTELPNVKEQRIDSIAYHTVQNNGSRLVDTAGNVTDDEGHVPEYLFRFVSKEEVDDILKHGKMIPSSFYGRIHASYKPDKRYITPNGTLLAIRYDENDAWRVKVASDDIYAVTDSTIDISKIKQVVGFD